MRRIIILLSLFFTCSFQIWATGDSLNYLLPSDTIFLSVGRFSEKVFEHRIEPKQTLYSLARFYGLSVEELYLFNPGLKEQHVSVGLPIQVPIPNRAIIRFKDKEFKENEHVPVFYVVRKGDTMFRISKYHFRMEISTLMERNELKDTNLKAGQTLHVGWMPLGGIPEEFRQSAGGPLVRRNNALAKIYRLELGNKKEYSEKGPAVWKTKSKEDSDLYCLHDNAPINSIIQVTNPMSRRTVYAKVVGRIPATRYGREIKTVLSPLAAKLLGAIDPKFYVKISYTK